MADKDVDTTCWICLSSDGDLVNPCNCPQDRVVHKKCLARWQLQSAGKSEEHRCRFCQAVYPSWKDSLTPAHLKPAIPVVSVHYNGVCYRLRVKPGPEGLASFQKQLQRITGLSVLDCMQITFQCRAPDTAQELSFKGISAFDAAIHCAAISAAERLATRKASSSTQSSGQPQPCSDQQEVSSSVPATSNETITGAEPSAGEGPSLSAHHRHAAGLTSLPSSTNSLMSAADSSPSASINGTPTAAAAHSLLGLLGRQAASAAEADASLRRGPAGGHAHAALQRVDSSVLLHSQQQGDQALHRTGSHKHASRLRRCREFLRNLFV